MTIIAATKNTPWNASVTSWHGLHLFILTFGTAVKQHFHSSSETLKSEYIVFCELCQWHQSQISRWTQRPSFSRLPLWLCRRGITLAVMSPKHSMFGRHDGQRPSNSWDAWMAPSPSSHATSSSVHRCHFPWSEWLPNHDAPLSFGNARSSGNIERTYWNRSDGRAICQTRCKSVSTQSSEDLSI